MDALAAAIETKERHWRKVDTTRPLLPGQDPMPCDEDDMREFCKAYEEVRRLTEDLERS